MTSYQYNGLGDRLTQNGTQYVLDLNADLTQVLDDGTNSYLYGLGRIAQANTMTEYFPGDALGSVRQLSMTDGEIPLAQSYDPYGNVTYTAGTSSTPYGFTGETTDSNGLVYLRARYYNVNDGRFLSRDTWGGDYNRPLSLNRWMYVEGNPVNLADPSGHFPNMAYLITRSVLSRYNSYLNLPSVLGDCTGLVDEYQQVDMTNYLALAMDKHGKDKRVKEIADLVSWATPVLIVAPPVGATIMASAYLKFLGLEGPEREWDIKWKMKGLADGGIVLCGLLGYCSWVDYSTAGNIHFGYVAGKAKMNELFAGVAGGALELFEQALEGEKVQWSNCRSNSMRILCDNPGDQAAVNLGFQLAREYPGGIKPYQLHLALHVHGFASFQKPPTGFAEPFPAHPEKNTYGADHFNN